MSSNAFFIVDLRREWKGQPYITFWRPRNANYAWPLSWAGRYTRDEVENGGGYYARREGRSLIRFAVPCAAAEKVAVDPDYGMIDGDAGPVVRNTLENRRFLRRHAINAANAVDDRL